MRAGLLNEIITLYQERKEVSASGFETKELVKVAEIKAYRRKLTAIVGDGVNASEEFIADNIIFQVRAYPVINEDMKIGYNGKMYSIILLNKQVSDNTYLITCSKKNT